MARLTRADLLVTGVRRLASHVAGLDRFHALQVVEYGLQAPETASGKRSDFLSCFGHVVLPFFTVSVLFCRVGADRITVCRIRSAAKSPARCTDLSAESNMSLLRSLLAADLVDHALDCSAHAAGRAVAKIACLRFGFTDAAYDAQPVYVRTHSVSVRETAT